MTITIDPLLAWKYQNIAALPAVPANAKWTNALYPGQILDVIVPAAGTCYYNVVNALGTVVATGTAAASSTQTLGPYNVLVSLTLLAGPMPVALNIARLN